MKRLGMNWFDDEYFCDDHAGEFDLPIAGDLVVRRVRVSCDILIAGTSMQAPICQGEALDALLKAINAAGGVLDVTGVRSTVGRYDAQAGAAGARSVSGVRE